MSRFVLAALLTLPFAGPIFAWNNAGHLAVAKLAWDQLDARERQALLELLKSHPHWERFFLTAGKPPGASEGDFRFALGSTWPDWLRGFAKSPDAEGKKIYLFHKGPRHYINWPFIHPRDRDQFTGPLPIPDAKENIILGLGTVMNELRETEKHSPKYRAVSLCWLLHLVGDLHQPLHNIGLISKYSPTGDLGGNLFWVKDQGQPVRLHGYWDDLLGKQESYAAGYDQAVATCAQLTRAEYQRDRFAKELERKTYEEWSKDAYALAVEHGYRNGNLRGWIVAFGKDTDEQKAKATELPVDYRDIAVSVAQRQAALAGHRLADLLHQVARFEMKD